MSERPAKRARGSYAKLICFRCRERRIKCQLADDGSVVPSSDPQPPDKACQRCSNLGLDCIVRKTTLGRPSTKRPSIPTPPSTGKAHVEDFRSPTPHSEDLLLLGLEEEKSGSVQLAGSLVSERPTSVQLMSAINKTFDLTSSLLGRDRRFGSSVGELREMTPLKIEDVVDEELAGVLDQQLVWHRLYMPWLPRLPALHKAVTRSDPGSGIRSSTSLLLSLLSSIALDVPSESITAEQRKIHRDLRCITYHSGQEVLFTLPRNEYTLNALEIVHGNRPLALITSQQAAAHTLSGKLYPTLVNAVAQQIGLHNAPSRLHEQLESGGSGDVHALVVDTLRWCTIMLYNFDKDLEEVEINRSEEYQPESVLKQALEDIAIAIDRGLASNESFFLYHILRYNADDLITIRSMTAEWKDLPKLASNVHTHEKLRDERRKHFEQGLAHFFYGQGRTDEAIVISQLSNMEINHGRTSVIGLAMFYAIVSGTRKLHAKAKDNHNPVVGLSKYFDEALKHEINHSTDNKSDVRLFLDQFGDVHMDGLERRLTDFINAATEVRLNGIPFVGPARHTTTNVLLACKEIVENNAVRIRLDRELHQRVDMQLILFQEAARRLEAMEADGDSHDAVARGSIFSASAKLIRSLHRIMSQWKRSYITHQHRPPTGQDTGFGDQPTANSSAGNIPPLPDLAPAFDPDGLFADGFFTDWDNWPQLDPTELSSFLNYDFDVNNMM